MMTAGPRSASRRSSFLLELLGVILIIAISGFFAGGAIASTDTTPPTIYNIMPSGWIASSDFTVSASYSDSGSGINPSTVYASLDGVYLGGCTVTTSQISCPVSGATGDHHTIAIGVKDNAGNLRTAFRTIGIDTTPPVITNIDPTGWVATSSPTISADLSDTQSGIDTASAFITLNDGPPLVDCTLVSGHLSCTTSGLADGMYEISVNVNDNAGNFQTVTSDFGVDTTGPAITGMLPAGTVYGSSTAVEADIADAGSGLDAATIAADVDLTPVSCTLTGSRLVCPVSDLMPGMHQGRISAADNLGNSSTQTWDFTIDTSLCGKTQLTLSAPRSFWASYSDYLARVVSVEWDVTNTGSLPASGVALDTSLNDNGVTLASTLPQSMTYVSSSPQKWTTVLQYNVPDGVSQWVSTLTATAQDSCATSYTYP